MVVLVVLAGLLGGSLAILRLLPERVLLQWYFQVSLFLGDAIVATDDEALVWLYTERRAVPFYLYSYRGRETVVPDAAAHRAYIERQGVTHIVLATPSGESAVRLRVLIEAYPGWLVPLRRFSGSRWLFAVARGGDDG